MKKYILSIVACFISFCMNAQTASTPAVLSLDEIRDLALKNNIAIRNASLKTDMASELRKEAFTKYFPVVNAVGMAFASTSDILKYNYKKEVEIPPIQDALPNGATFDLDLKLGLIDKGIMAGVNILQPVYTGGLIRNGNKLAELGEAVAELQSQQSKDQVLVTVEQYYWQLASLKSKRTTVNHVIALLDTLERQVSMAVKAGVVMRNDLLEVQLRRNEMLTGRVELENGISLVSLLLGQYIGKGMVPVDIKDSIPLDAEIEKPALFYMAPSDALASTIDYQLLQQNVKASELERKIAYGANLPKVGVGAGFFYNNLIEQGHGFGAIYAVVTVPISGWWGGSHAVKQMRIKETIAKNQLDDYSELLQVKMKNAWDAMNTSYDKIGIARQSVEFAQENLRLNQNYYRAGTVTITDLLKAQSLYLQSNDQYVDAYGNYRIKIVEYLQSTGR